MKDPINQKLALFNEYKVKYSVAEWSPRAKNKKSGVAAELVYVSEDQDG